MGTTTSHATLRSWLALDHALTPQSMGKGGAARRQSLREPLMTCVWQGWLDAATLQ
jgi:hypothetical protein